MLRYTCSACLVISAGSCNFLAASTLRRAAIEKSRHAFHNLGVISFQSSLKINCSRRTYVNYVRCGQICKRFLHVGNAIGCYSRAMFSRKGKLRNYVIADYNTSKLFCLNVGLYSRSRKSEKHFGLSVPFPFCECW